MVDFQFPDFGDFSMPSFDTDNFMEFATSNRYQKPKYHAPIKQKCVKYGNAEKLAKEIGVLAKNGRANVIVNGKFIFGDFIEAFIIENDLIATEMTISTLSYSKENIDSLNNLSGWDRLDKLNLICSHRFYVDNKGAIPYALELLDTDELDFQLAIAEVHTKVAIFETDNGMKYVMHGSANLRSCGGIEQFTIEENEEMYDLHHSFYQNVIKKFKIINKDQPKMKAVRANNINKLIAE